MEDSREFGTKLEATFVGKLCPEQKRTTRALLAHQTGVLAATVQRKDGHHPIIFMQCGPIRHRVTAKDLAAVRPFQHQVIVRPTSFRSIHEPEEDARVEFQELCKSLIGDRDRNTLLIHAPCLVRCSNKSIPQTRTWIGLSGL